MWLRIDKRGVALVLALVIFVVCAGLLAAIMYFSTTGTEVSGMQRRYQSAKEASLGAVDMTTNEIINRVIGGENLSDVRASLLGVTGILSSVTIGGPPSTFDPCFRNKLTFATGSWGCSSANADLSVTSNTPDLTFNLLSTQGSSRPYEVKLKIIDTVAGNSSMSGVILEGGGSAESQTGQIQVAHRPYFYTIVTESRMQGSTTERANLEILYAY
jgi:hypothetical protein